MAGALAASGANATGVGYKTIYNQNRGGNELSSNSHMKPPSNAGATSNNRSPRVGRVRGVSPGGSREKPTPGGKSSSSQVTAQSSSFAGQQQFGAASDADMNRLMTSPTKIAGNVIAGGQSNPTHLQVN